MVSTNADRCPQCGEDAPTAAARKNVAAVGGCALATLVVTGLGVVLMVSTCFH